MNDVGNLWECDPDKNTECKKTGCRACGGECWCTTNKAYSTGKRAINIDPVLRHEYRKAIVREAQRKRRALARAAGLCAICGKNVKAPGRATCEQCGTYAKEYQRRRRQ